MIPFIQSGKANCWQTAVACVLEVNPNLLPPQMEIEQPEYQKVLNGWGSYLNVLNGYLGKHHNLRYVTIQKYQLDVVRPLVDCFHVMTGPTVRTAQLSKEGSYHVNHCVVGRNGEFVWDVHPTQVGLTEVHDWGLFGILPQEEKEKRITHHNPMFHMVFNECLCPNCSLDKLRKLVAEAK